MTTPGGVDSVRVGAIDCGTNSIRLLVAEGVPGEAGPTDVTREMRIIRLGEGVDATGRLSDGALSRCRTALTDYTATMAELGVQSVRMVATSATRDARNKDEFFGMTAEVLGKPFPGAQAEVISGQTEAELTFAGGVSDLRPEDGPFVVTDLGGGSTEIVVGELVGGQVRLLGARSLDVGCVRITERVLHSDPPTSTSTAAGAPSKEPRRSCCRPATRTDTGQLSPRSAPTQRGRGTMTPEEARSLGRAIRAVRLHRGLSQLKLAVAIGVKSPWISAWERGQAQPTAHGPAATPSALSRDQLAAIADALDCTVGEIADRAALSATTRLLYGLEPLGPARTVIGGQEYDLTDAESDKAAAFVAGLIAARDLH